MKLYKINCWYTYGDGADSRNQWVRARNEAEATRLWTESYDLFNPEEGMEHEADPAWYNDENNGEWRIMQCGVYKKDKDGNKPEGTAFNFDTIRKMLMKVR